MTSRWPGYAGLTSLHVTAWPLYGGMMLFSAIGAVVEGVPTTSQTPLFGQRWPVLAVILILLCSAGWPTAGSLSDLKSYTNEVRLLAVAGRLRSVVAITRWGEKWTAQGDRSDSI